MPANKRKVRAVDALVIAQFNEDRENGDEESMLCENRHQSTKLVKLALQIKSSYFAEWFADNERERKEGTVQRLAA